MLRKIIYLQHENKSSISATIMPLRRLNLDFDPINEDDPFKRAVLLNKRIKEGISQRDDYKQEALELLHAGEELHFAVVDFKEDLDAPRTAYCLANFVINKEKQCLDMPYIFHAKHFSGFIDTYKVKNAGSHMINFAAQTSDKIFNGKNKMLLRTESIFDNSIGFYEKMGFQINETVLYRRLKWLPFDLSFTEDRKYRARLLRNTLPF